MKQGTILNHLWRAVQAGERVRPGHLLNDLELRAPAQQRALDAFGEHGAEFLRPAYEALGETVPYDALHLLRLHFVLGHRP